jgi:(p)ppGpp synthase/HD superfamily hydrolase
MREKAIWFADRLHSQEGQSHNGRPYIEHPLDAEAILAEYGFTGLFWSLVAILHDVIEDCLKSFSPEDRYRVVALLFDADVAQTVWCVSGFGENRKERNACMKAKIIGDTSHRSAILKLADRLANLRGAKKGSKYWLMYRGELREFETYIREHVPPGMWQELEYILADDHGN